MRLRTVALASVSLACALATAEPAPSGPWQYVRDDDGIHVDKRSVPGSNLAEFRGRAVVDAPLSSVMAVLHDAPRRTEWMERCIDSRMLEDGTGTQLSYSRTHAPWPIADRDVVVRAETSFDDASHTVRIEFHDVEDARMPPTKGVVRMPFFRGHFYLRPTPDRAHTEVEYQVHANSGGLLPDWIANRVAREIPYKSLLALRAQVRRRQYPDFERWLVARPEYQSMVRP
jgi:hypothetical protein